MRILIVGVLVVIGLIVFLEAVGEPILRWEYSYSPIGGGRKIVHSGTYVGVSGTHRVVSGQYADGCPLIVFRDLNQPLIVSLWEAIQAED
ncbi:MAG: hypothetical protein V2I43_28960 [Parvularcula sp.]|nr:hypothetical protein [Parvularcula sp.]